MRGHRHRGDLGLVAHFGEEKGEQRGAEDAQPLRQTHLIGVDPVGDQHPDGHGQERQPQHRAQHGRIDRARDPGAHAAGEAMVEQRGDQNTQHDGHGAPEARGEDEGEQLGLVADFSQRDEAGGDEEGFHEIPRPERRV